jgi:hypothetical protein
MPHLDIPFEEVPNEIRPVQPGTYTLEIMDVPTIEPTKSGNGQKLVVQMTIQDDGEFKGRRIQDHISTKMQTKIKRLAIAAGLDPDNNGIDTEEMAGRQVKARVKSNTFTNDFGEEIENARIQDYLIK